MGYDLTNAAGASYQWKVLGWWHLTNLARRYGWSPAGTQLVTDATATSQWNGNYFENAGQEVRMDDALALAEALQRMLDDPQRDKVAREVSAEMQGAIDDRKDYPSTAPMDVLRYPVAFIRKMMEHFKQDHVGVWNFDDESDEYLKGFIKFCQSGPFRIE